MKKINLDGFQNQLSRNAMKNILGGNDGNSGLPIGTPECSEMCSSDSDCSGNTSCPKCKSGSGPNGGKGCAA